MEVIAFIILQIFVPDFSGRIIGYTPDPQGEILLSLTQRISLVTKTK